MRNNSIYRISFYPPYFKFIKSSLNGLVNPNYSNYGKTEYWNTLTWPL